MKIRLVVSPMRYSKQESDPIEVPDGMTDEEIDDYVSEDLQGMAAELVDAWWERVE